MYILKHINLQQVESAIWLHENFHSGEMKDCPHTPCRMAVAIMKAISPDEPPNETSAPSSKVQ